MCATRRAEEAIGAEQPASRLMIEPAAWTPPFDWPALYGNRDPVELEIGCGKGMFLKEAALRFGDRNYLGVDTAGRFLRVGEQRLQRAGIERVRLMRADGLDVLQRWIEPGSVRTLHIYFPDPWPKKRHRKRRIFRPALLELAATALRPAGELRVATDDPAYAEQIRELLASAPDRFRPHPWSPEDPERLPTNYARKWLRAGRTLWWARYRLAAED